MSYSFYIGIPIKNVKGEADYLPLRETYKNYTYNCSNAMYEAFKKCRGSWREFQQNKPRCGDVIELLNSVIQELEENIDYYRKYDPENGWGSIEGNIEFLKHILLWCETITYGVVIIR